MLSLNARITFGYTLPFVMLTLVTVCDVWKGMFDAEMSYRFTLAAIAVVALGCTVQQSSFYGFTSMLPSRYTQAVMTGESAAGLIVSINRILTKALVQDMHTSTITFFVLGVVCVSICFFVFHVSRRTEFTRYYVSRCKSAGIADDQRAMTFHMSVPEEVDIMEGTAMTDSYGQLVLQSPTTPPGDSERQQQAPSTASQINDGVVKNTLSHQEAEVLLKSKSYGSHIGVWENIKEGCRSRYRVAQIAWPYMLSIAITYFVTLCLFPGIESEVISCRLRSWMPVVLIAIFNLFDFAGKILASLRYDWPRDRLVLLSLSRVLLVPLMMMSVMPRTKPVLHDDTWPIVMSLLLGVSNGYFGSVPMILAPGNVPDAQKELTGNIMTLSYSVGLTSGSAVAYLLDSLTGPRLAYDPCILQNLTTPANIFANVSTTVKVLSQLPDPDSFVG
ncbi:Equilibrative nucleoside transporter 4 [Lamellibrachia satsuma]|nr:Equilibrative nucleoside transporter 4 [Lamellibrachia satsuma]